VYNALIPKRAAGVDWQTIVHADDPATIWHDYVPFDMLPQVENPPSGFVQTCNSTPFSTTTGRGNPTREPWMETAGIEGVLTNRAARSLELLGVPQPLDRAAFLAMKWDRTYAKDARIFRDVVRPILTQVTPASADEREAFEILRAWDGIAADDSAGATLAILLWRQIVPEDAGAKGDPKIDPARAFRQTVRGLVETFGTVRVPLAKMQRIRHGSLDLALGGGPDVINAVVAHRAWDGKLVGYQGDSYVLEVEIGASGVSSRSIHQYGASLQPRSPHYSDQSKMYVAHELKPTWRDPAELAKHTERRYHPGE
jgi:acyl-homoserine lactone acylase PvdQ